MNDSQKINYLAGQVAALEAFAISIISTHPAIAQLRADFTRLNAVQGATSMNKSVTEEYLDGRAAVADGLQNHMDAVAESKA